MIKGAATSTKQIQKINAVRLLLLFFGLNLFDCGAAGFFFAVCVIKFSIHILPFLSRYANLTQYVSEVPL